MIGNAAILDTAIERLNNLEQSLEEFMSRLMQNPEFTDWLTFFNRDQMYHGKRPDDSDIEKTPQRGQVSNKYEPITKWLKYKKNQPWDRVTLLDTGDFYASERVKVAGNEIELFATDPKTQELLQTWGNVLGVSNENLEKFIEIIKPEFISFAKNYFA